MFAAALMCVPVTTVVAGAALATMIYLGVLGYHRLPMWSVLIVALMIFFNGVFSACRSRVVKQQDFTLIAQTGFVQNLARAIAPLATFWLAPFWLGLTLGELTGRLAGVRQLVRQVGARRVRGSVWGHPYAWIRLVRSQYRFSIILTGTVLVDACASQLISPVLAANYGAQAVGTYFLVAMIMVGPSVLIGAGAADVIHAKGAEIFHARPAELPRFTIQAAISLLGLGMVIFAPIYAVAPHLFPFIFGSRWPHIAETVQALTPFAIIGFVASPCSRLLASINRPTVKVISDVFRLTGVPAVIYWSHTKGATFVEAMWNLSWFLAGAYAFYLFLTYAVVLVTVRSLQQSKP